MLMSTHWSPLSGVPGCSRKLSYGYLHTLEKGDSTEVTIIQDNNSTEQEKEHSEQNWKTVLDWYEKIA